MYPGRKIFTTFCPLDRTSVSFMLPQNKHFHRNCGIVGDLKRTPRRYQRHREQLRANVRDS